MNDSQTDGEPFHKAFWGEKGFVFLTEKHQRDADFLRAVEGAIEGVAAAQNEYAAKLCAISETVVCPGDYAHDSSVRIATEEFCNMLNSAGERHARCADNLTGSVAPTLVAEEEDAMKVVGEAARMVSSLFTTLTKLRKEVIKAESDYDAKSAAEDAARAQQNAKKRQKAVVKLQAASASYKKAVQECSEHQGHMARQFASATDICHDWFVLRLNHLSDAFEVTAKCLQDCCSEGAATADSARCGALAGIDVDAEVNHMITNLATGDTAFDTLAEFSQFGSNADLKRKRSTVETMRVAKISGPLEQRGRVKWTRRYFELYGSDLVFWKSLADCRKRPNIPTGSFVIHPSAVVSQDLSTKRVFTIRMDDVLTMRAESEGECEKWVTAILSVLATRSARIYTPLTLVEVETKEEPESVLFLEKRESVGRGGGGDSETQDSTNTNADPSGGASKYDAEDITFAAAVSPVVSPTGPGDRDSFFELSDDSESAEYRPRQIRRQASSGVIRTVTAGAFDRFNKSQAETPDLTNIQENEGEEEVESDVASDLGPPSRSATPDVSTSVGSRESGERGEADDVSEGGSGTFGTSRDDTATDKGTTEVGECVSSEISELSDFAADSEDEGEGVTPTTTGDTHTDNNNDNNNNNNNNNNSATNTDTDTTPPSPTTAAKTGLLGRTKTSELAPVPPRRPGSIPVVDTFIKKFNTAESPLAAGTPATRGASGESPRTSVKGDGPVAPAQSSMGVSGVSGSESESGVSGGEGSGRDFPATKLSAEATASESGTGEQVATSAASTTTTTTTTAAAAAATPTATPSVGTRSSGSEESDSPTTPDKQPKGTQNPSSTSTADKHAEPATTQRPTEPTESGAESVGSDSPRSRRVAEKAAKAASKTKRLPTRRGGASVFAGFGNNPIVKDQDSSDSTPATPAAPAATTTTTTTPTTNTQGKSDANSTPTPPPTSTSTLNSSSRVAALQTGEGSGSPIASRRWSQHNVLPATTTNQGMVEFIDAVTMEETFTSFVALCKSCGIRSLKDPDIVYDGLRRSASCRRDRQLFECLDAKRSSDMYVGAPAAGSRVLIVGGGPAGLRLAVEAALLGATVTVVEKRTEYHGLHVLPLWSFAVADLVSLGGRILYPHLCHGGSNHVSVRRVEAILLKVALVLGVKIHAGVEFVGIVNADDDHQWTAAVNPPDHPVTAYEFNALFGASGSSDAFSGFSKRVFRCSRSVGVTANFVNKHSSDELAIEEIPLRTAVYHPDWFAELRNELGLDLESVVYYQDETHYLVLSCDNASLLANGVIRRDSQSMTRLLAQKNIDARALCDVVERVADKVLGLPHRSWAANAEGLPDVQIVDFTRIRSARSAAKVVQTDKHSLVLGLVGDCLMEPFWPRGGGLNRGFLSALDAAWMLKKRETTDPLELLRERENVYRVLASAEDHNVNPNVEEWTLDPASRYQAIPERASEADVAKLLIAG